MYLGTTLQVMSFQTTESDLAWWYEMRKTDDGGDGVGC